MFCVFFVKQKTAYDMRISDWSSDVCSSDLLGWSETDYANIVLWFQAAYAIGYLGFGRLVDKIGARLGYAFAFTLWTVAHILHGAVRTTFGFGAVRFMLGIGESGSFPAGLKAVATWFPARERALATGIFNAGTNVGAIITPLIVPIITVAYGWRDRKSTRLNSSH